MPARQLIAYVVSDVHLNNHAYGLEKSQESPARQNFQRFILDLQGQLAPEQKLLLVFNGDTLDITGSWFEPVLPWDSDTSRVEAALLAVMRDILDHNHAIIEALKALMAHPNVELFYVIGNHDRLVGLFASVQQLLKDHLCSTLESQSRLQFLNRFESVELGMYVEHGHRFDPFNHEEYQQRPPLGDVINVLIVNRFVDCAVRKMQAQGYSRELIAEVRNRLQDAEYLRPLSLGPYWLQSLAERYKDHAENHGKTLPINLIIQQVISETLLTPEMVSLTAERAQVPRPLMRWLLQALVQHPGLLPRLSFLVARLMHKTETNQYQYAMAQQIRHKSGFHLISFGHTHIPSLIPLSERDYFFNTGCWKPIINLFQPQKGQPQVLQGLLASVPFNRIERSGVFRVERDLAQPLQPNRFSIITIQNGLS